MQPLDETRARSRVYNLFSHLYERGLTTDVLSVVRAIPDLASLLPNPFDEDEAAADHYTLFGLEVFPYAGLFLDVEGRLGGPTAGQVQRLYAQIGFQPVLDRESADHLGHELALLAFLSEAEAEAAENAEPHEIERVRRLLRQFVDDHLLEWLPAFVCAVEQQPYPFYATLSRLTLDVVLDHRAGLDDEGAEHTRRSARTTPAPPPDLLDEADTGLKEIAEYLATPPRSGFFLSRRDISQLGRAERLPRGFGSRVQTLANLLRAAAEFDRMEALLEALGKRIDTWERFYLELHNNDLESVRAVSQTWLERLAGTKQLLERMRVAGRSSVHLDQPDPQPSRARDRINPGVC